MMAFSPALMVVLDVEVDTGFGTAVELVWLADDGDTSRPWMCTVDVADAEMLDMSLEARSVLVDRRAVVVGTE